MSWLLHENDKPYIDASKTNVQDTWRRFGWVPPSELKESDKPDTISALPLLNERSKQ